MKRLSLAILMASLMFSVQISFSGCGNSDNESVTSPDGSANHNVPSNNYNISARIVGLNMGFGGLSSCGDVVITNNGETVADAIVMVNSDTLAYSYGTYQNSLAASSDYNLTINHNGNLIASGSTKIPDSEPEITNLDSGDVHTAGTDLLVEWSNVSNITSYQVVSTYEGGSSSISYESELLPLNVQSHTIRGNNFIYLEDSPSNLYSISVNAIYGLYPGDDEALSENPQVGYEIEGPSGYLIGLTQSSDVEIQITE